MCVNEHLPLLKVPRTTLRDILKACTTVAPFLCPEGKLYRQVDNVALGSPMGVLFAQAFMSHVESSTMQSEGQIPSIYCKYYADIFVCVDKDNTLGRFRGQLQEFSVLKFTIEKSEGSRIPFLDVVVDGISARCITDVHRKPTDAGNCMNGKIEYIDRYKRNVINVYVGRAIRTCSSWELLHHELDRIRQIVENNN
nr:uncharacterized protein LOC123772741 [Procambarus clarkii]